MVTTGLGALALGAASAGAQSKAKAPVAWAKGIEGQRRADLGNGLFINPIMAGDHPDPSILKDGDDYYWDRVTVIEAWADTRKTDHARRVQALVRELIRMGRALRQKAVAYVVNGGLVVLDVEERNP